MSPKRIFTVLEHPPLADAAILLARLVCGLAFMTHGWSKIQKPFTWMGPDAFAPGIFQALAALAEFGGGLAWILGALTPLASFGVACTMIVATWVHAIQRGDPFVGKGGPSYELAAVFFSIAVLFIAIGPGRFSVDRILFGRRE